MPVLRMPNLARLAGEGWPSRRESLLRQGRLTAGSDPNWVAAAYDISHFASATTTIRFMTHFEDNDYYDTVYIDNVAITWQPWDAWEHRDVTAVQIVVGFEFEIIVDHPRVIGTHS